jgi:SSS family transporter
MTRFSGLDLGIFAVYLAASVAVGLLFTRKQRTIADYFLAGRSMRSLVVAVSVLAALFSGITYLGSAGEVYVHDFSFVLVALSFFIATPVTTMVFLPYFYRRPLYTAYQYLEERFSLGVRTLGAVLFVTRVVLWLALATYAPALALQQATGLPLWFSILVTGLLTTLYTTLGGMMAVIWTDALQFVVLFGGQLLILVTAMRRVPGGLAGILALGQAGGKLTVSLSLDPLVRVTLWGLFLGQAFHNLVQLATDQVSVQRYLTSTSLRTAQRSLWLKLALTVPTLALFYFSGVVLFAFYRVHGDPLASGAISGPDQILPYFVVNELSRGLPGLLIAAIFAASMSTVSAGINSLTTVSLVDIWTRLWRPRSSEKDQFRLARRLNLGYGLLVMLLAFIVSRFGTLVEGTVKMMGLTGGPLLGIFLLGMLSKRARAKGAVLGWLAGFGLLLPVCFATRISFLWYAAIGCLMTYGVGLLASRLKI